MRPAVFPDLEIAMGAVRADPTSAGVFTPPPSTEGVRRYPGEHADLQGAPTARPSRHRPDAIPFSATPNEGTRLHVDGHLDLIRRLHLHQVRRWPGAVPPKVRAVQEARAAGAARRWHRVRVCRRAPLEEHVLRDRRLLRRPPREPADCGWRRLPRGGLTVAVDIPASATTRRLVPMFGDRPSAPGRSSARVADVALRDSIGARAVLVDTPVSRRPPGRPSSSMILV